MRNFFQSYWKVILAILLAILLATLTVETKSGPPPLALRLQSHVHALASGAPYGASRHIAASLTRYGYAPQPRQAGAVDHPGRRIEATVANLAPGAAPSRTFIVGARPGAEGDVGVAAVLEMARAARRLPLAPGTEIRFVFFMPDDGVAGADRMAVAGRRSAGNFMAYVGTRASSERVRRALAALRSDALLAQQGLTAPAHVLGLTLSGHGGRVGAPALVITDTDLLRFPYFRVDTAPGQARDRNDYDGMARIVSGLSHTLGVLAGVVEA